MKKHLYLKKVPLFEEFKEQDLIKLGKIGAVNKFQTGEMIFTESDSGDKLYIVISGRVKIYTGSGKKKKTLAFLEEGEFFGEMALLDEAVRSASALALDECELLVINKKNFRNLLAKHPKITFLVTRTLSRRLRWADKEIESLTFENVLSRIAKALVDLSIKYGEKTNGNVRIKIALSHQDIAEFASTGREMVSRILNRLRRLNCVSYEKKYLTITNMEKLKGWI